MFTDAMQQRLREEFSQVIEARTFRADDPAARRGYIKAHLEFIHFVERPVRQTPPNAPRHFDKTELHSKNQLPVP